jgi:hypothetical protein
LSDLQSTQPCPIKVTDPVPISTRADEKALENAKTSKVTAVVVVMHIYGNTKSNLPNTSAKNRAKKTKLESKSKKLGLSQPKTCLKEAQQPPEDASKRLLVKHKTIRVLFDTDQVGTSFSQKKRSNKYIPVVRRVLCPWK